MQESDSIIEFLSDPWVLVQVLHFPGVLQQWLLAATAEVLRFQQQMSDFLFLPYPETWDPIVRILTYHINIFALSVEAGFQELQFMAEDHENEYSTKKAYEPCFERNDLDAILSRLMMLRSVKGQNFINFFKRVCWNKPNEACNQTLVQPQMLPPKCIHDSYLQYFQKIHSACGFTGNLLFSAKDIRSCALNCCDCEECFKMYGEIIKERSGFFKTLADCKDANLTKMSAFYDLHLKERFPDVEKELFSAHLLDKEILYLHWKLDAVSSKIKTNINPKLIT
jgi:hypothetical protein